MEGVGGQMLSGGFDIDLVGTALPSMVASLTPCLATVVAARPTPETVGRAVHPGL